MSQCKQYSYSVIMNRVVTRLILERDSLATILVLNNPSYCTDWLSSGIIADVLFHLSSFSSWSATKVSRSINLWAHLVAKWAAFSQLLWKHSHISSFSLCCKNQEWT
jgi:hypothetical protein